MKIFADLRDRRVAPIVVTYLAVGWVGLQVVDQVVDRGVLPELAYVVALTLAVTLFPAALILAWFHGEKGRQPVPFVERSLLLGVVVLAVGTTTLVVQTRIGPAEPGALVELQPWEDPRRVAALYFDVGVGGDEAEALAAGLTESLIEELSAVDALHVVSRHGSQRFREASVPIREIGRELEVGSLVSGRVDLGPDTVRVTVELIGTEGGELIRAPEPIVRPRGEILELQQVLASQAADLLRRRIGEEIGTLQMQAGTDSPEAWEWLARGNRVADDARALAEAGELSEASDMYVQADSLLARAEAADPEWAEPIVRRGWIAYRQARLGGFDRRHHLEWIEQGLAHAERGLALDSVHSRGLELKATLLYLQPLLNLTGSDEESTALMHEAETLYENAVEIDPKNASAWSSLSHLRARWGQTAEARLAARMSYRSDPYLANAETTLFRLAGLAWDAEDSIDAERWCDEGAERFPTNYRFSQCQLQLFGMPDVTVDVASAWEWQRRWVRNAPPAVTAINEKISLAWMSLALARAGLPDSARAVAIRSRSDPQVDPMRVVPRIEAIARVALGDLDEATSLMAEFFAADPSHLSGYRHAVEHRQLPWFYDGLEDHPPFRALLAGS